MKYVVFYTLLLFSILIQAQDKFTFTENGLTPKYLICKITDASQTELFTKSLQWIEKNKQKFNLSILKKNDAKVIVLTRKKENAVRLKKQYFHIQYTITISFAKGHYKFEPTLIQLKLNSKYDMGWKTFSINNTNDYIKNGKVKRKYKTYMTNIIDLLNNLNTIMYNDLKNLH